MPQNPYLFRRELLNKQVDELTHCTSYCGHGYILLRCMGKVVMMIEITKKMDRDQTAHKVYENSFRGSNSAIFCSPVRGKTQDSKQRC